MRPPGVEGAPFDAPPCSLLRDSRSRVEAHHLGVDAEATHRLDARDAEFDDLFPRCDTGIGAFICHCRSPIWRHEAPWLVELAGHLSTSPWLYSSEIPGPAENPNSSFWGPRLPRVSTLATPSSTTSSRASIPTFLFSLGFMAVLLCCVMTVHDDPTIGARNPDFQIISASYSANSFPPHQCGNPLASPSIATISGTSCRRRSW